MGDNARIICFGDSTTAERMVNGERLTIYSHLLNGYFEKHGVAYEAVNSGLSGSHTRQALDRLHRDVCSHSPTLVVIQFGINDSWIDGEQEGASRIPLEEYRENLEKMISEISESGSGTVLMTPNQIGARYEAWRYRRLERYADAVRKTAEAHTVDFIDIWRLYDHRQPVDGLLLDGMHPNEKGHALVADALIRLLEDKYIER